MRRFAGTAALAALILTPSMVAPQAPVRVEEDADCHRSDRGDRYCEVREYRLDARSSLHVDGGGNGGIRVTGWDRNEIRLIARVQVTTRDRDPRELARDIEIRTSGVIGADGPRTRGRDQHWGVSYELFVPHDTSLRLEARNGGIGLEALSGDVVAHTTNGGISLTGGAGHVRGETTNGGVRVELTGRTWEGEGVDLKTTNGGVVIRVPQGYAVDLETGTVNGGMEFDIPVMVQGRIDRRIRTELGGGGPLVRAITTNGGVVIRGG